MSKILAPIQGRKATTLNNISLSKGVADKLATNKVPIDVKNGVAQITPNHPDFRFWTED